MRLLASLIKQCITPQVVAYNKMDLPDSSDYWEDVRATLIRDKGLAPESCFAVSSATGAGVQPLVRRLHVLLDALPQQVGSSPFSVFLHLHLATHNSATHNFATHTSTCTKLCQHSASSLHRCPVTGSGRQMCSVLRAQSNSAVSHAVMGCT